MMIIILIILGLLQNSVTNDNRTERYNVAFDKIVNSQLTNKYLFDLLSNNTNPQIYLFDSTMFIIPDPIWKICGNIPFNIPKKIPDIRYKKNNNPDYLLCFYELDDSVLIGELVYLNKGNENKNVEMPKNWEQNLWCFIKSGDFYNDTMPQEWRIFRSLFNPTNLIYYVFTFDSYYRIKEYKEKIIQLE